MKNISLESIGPKALEIALKYGPKLLMAIATLVIGLWIINFICSRANKLISKMSVDQSVSKFLISMASMLLKILLFISVASMLGVATTSFVAILGALGLAVGMALQGSLANFAGGVIILILKPFKIGDYIQTPEAEGCVTDIQIFHTFLKTLDNKKVILPNGQLSNGRISNFSAEENRRVDFSFGIGYGDSIDKATKTIQQTIESSQFALMTPAPRIAVVEHGESSVNFAVHVWTKSSDYWELHFEIPGLVKKAFDRENISIPYPQMDIHHINKPQA